MYFQDFSKVIFQSCSFLMSLHSTGSRDYSYTVDFDNVNMKTKPEEQHLGSLCKQYNMVQAFASLDRIPIPEEFSSADYPSAEQVEKIDIKTLLPTKADEESLKTEMVVVVERILVEELDAFNSSKAQVEWHIPHQYSAESSQKSVIVSLYSQTRITH